MGIYQGVLSIGIMASSFFTSFLKDQFNSMENNLAINLSIVAFLVASCLLFILISKLDKKNQKLFINHSQNNVKI